jgi:4-diphosphocytidyl-2-C-methyl-D-erythritol kinase
MLTEAVTLSVYDPLEFAALLQNDLEPAALELFPEAGNALELLREAGAEAAHLSGSGPTAFGLFGSREAADAAQAAIAPRWSGGALTVHQAPSDYTLVRSSED